MIATLAAIGVLILEGLITSMFERLHAKTAAASQGPAGVAGNGNAAEFTTANVYGHAHDPESTKQDKVRHLTIAQVRPGQPTHGCRANQRACTSRSLPACASEHAVLTSCCAAPRCWRPASRCTRCAQGRATAHPACARLPPTALQGVGGWSRPGWLAGTDRAPAAQVLIGVALGVSSDLGTVRSLLAALAFHQFFEGVALGACFIEVS
jgi:hypothetical protein